MQEAKDSWLAYVRSKACLAATFIGLMIWWKRQKNNFFKDHIKCAPGGSAD